MTMDEWNALTPEEREERWSIWEKTVNEMLIQAFIDSARRAAERIGDQDLMSMSAEEIDAFWDEEERSCK